LLAARDFGTGGLSESGVSGATRSRSAIVGKAFEIVFLSMAEGSPFADAGSARATASVPRLRSCADCQHQFCSRNLRYSWETYDAMTGSLHRSAVSNALRDADLMSENRLLLMAIQNVRLVYAVLEENHDA
jgi:hypothetical protein